MSGTPRHLSSHIRTHRLRSDRSKVSFSGIPSLPIILLDNVSGSHRRLSYDTLGWDGELDRMTTSPSDIVGTGFGLISHPYSPFTSVPNLGTSLATRRRSLLYFYQLRRPSLISITFYFSSFWDYLGFSISLFELSRENNDNFLLYDATLADPDLGPWIPQRLPTLITSNPSGKEGEIGLSIHAYHHISSISSSLHRTRFVSRGHSRVADGSSGHRSMAVGHSSSTTWGLFISLSLFLGFMGSRFTIRCLVRI
jgi:hypothetical protein